MNKIDGIFAIAHIKNIVELWAHYLYDVLYKKLRLVRFNQQQDCFIQALITQILFETTFYTGNI